MKNSIVLVVSALLVAIDQLLKSWALKSLAGGPSVMLIPGLLQLTYVENRGAAFGILQGRVGLLSIVTLVVLAGAVILLLRGRFQHPVARWSAGLIIAGGAGNLVDRMGRAFVVDYLDISPLFSFPVFNFADCCVVCGTILLAIYLLCFEGKEEHKLVEAVGSEAAEPVAPEAPAAEAAEAPEPSENADVE